MQPAAVYQAVLRALPGEPLARGIPVHGRAHPFVLPQEVVLLFLLLFCPPLRVGAQDVKAIHANYEWGSATAWDPRWTDPSDRTEILEDELSIRLKNTKPQFLALFFERRQVIRFASEEDILRHGRYTLPESLDPPYDQRFPPVGRPAEAPRPLWFNVRLDHFAARIIRPDGTWGEVGAFAHVDRQQVRTFRSMETAWSYVLDLQAIAPGDVVEVRWKYMVPYDVNGGRTHGWRGFEWMDNWARLTNWRIFFHDELPIRHQRLSIRYHARHGLSLKGTVPHRSSEEGNEREAIWEQVDLPGCMDEVNARPGVDLPHVRVTLQPEDYRYWMRDRLSGVAIPQPHWLYVLRLREARAIWWRRVAMKNVPDRQNKLFQEFVERTVLGIPEQRTARRMEALHEYIAEHFTYRNDSLWFQEIDRGLPRIGDQVSDERIREISRYDLYAKLVYALEAAYSTAYLLDKRIGVMDDRWMTPLWDSDLLMGVEDVDRTMWMYPKRGPVGLWADELPFYWQGSNALIMNTDFLLADVPPPPLFIDLPLDDARANIRALGTRLEVSPSTAAVSGTTRVLLSGQFSTLGRGAYKGLPIDPTVHPFYGDVLQRILPSRTGAWEVRSNSTDPPFRFQAERSIAPSAILTQMEEGTWTMDLSQFVSHAVPTNFTADGRDLPFHWDFPQEDRSIIDLHFDRPVELVNADAFTVTASSPTASIQRSITMDKPGHIRIESRLVVVDTREEPENAPSLENVIRLARGEDLTLHFRTLADQP